jgi:curved DNA-binding protein
MPSKFKDYYEVLGVSRTASEDDIKQAYRRLAREHHPDLHSEKEKDLSARRMQDVNEAYAVLGSKENRTKYNQLGANWEQGPVPDPPPQRGQAGGFSDFFENMFRQSQGESAPEDLTPSELDIEAVLDLSLEEAIRGVEKSLTLSASGLCHNCRGSGRKNGVFCHICGGVGEIRRRREIKTKIPPGLHEGSRIRLKGQGNEGRGVTGDLYLHIHLLPHPHFTVDGTNLETDVILMPWQAVLGSEVIVPTLEGSVRVRVPKGTRNGSRLRLAGKGLGKPGARGDLFVRELIDIPASLSPKATALFKQLEEEHEKVS